jgi:transcriptional regulator with XRE-family HTH domain
MVIGQRIKLFREQAGLKQSDVADQSGISRVAIGNYERGDRIPSVEIAKKIADVFGISVNELLYPDEAVSNMPKIVNLDIEALQKKLDERSEKLTVLVKLFDGMNEDGQAKLIEYASDMVNHPVYKRDNSFRKK